ncbi:BID domain-containing T4SS effector [Bartonella sp. CB178]|uniref:BID domain-containing T4SS effector n=1 Tax=Bartonella sp. CB178 TaxID=3112255 RepID=UPI00300E0BE2
MKKTKLQEPVYADLSSHYHYPETGVLKNKYLIKDAAELEQKRRSSEEIARFSLQSNPVRGPMDSRYLRDLHVRLNGDVFEWAGILRSEDFVFADGSKASMPIVTKEGVDSGLFATGKGVIENLKRLDQSLTDSNYLKGLSHEQFVDGAARMFVLLHQTRPFVAGNKLVCQVFMQHLAEEAGHKLDFSLVQQDRLYDACKAAMRNNDFSLVNGLFEDISNPEKMMILKESVSHVRQDGGVGTPAMALPGETYAGVCVGSGDNCCTVRVGSAYFAVSKDNLTPEQIKTLKYGEEVHFTALADSQLENRLIPGERFGSLKRREISEKIAENSSVRMARMNVERLARFVYGSESALNNVLACINASPELGESCAQQIEDQPKSIGKLAGKKYLGCFKSHDRRVAESSLPGLCDAIECYADAAVQAKREVLQDDRIERERRGQEVLMPSVRLQKLLEFSPMVRQEALQNSPSLQRDLDVFLKRVNDRLSRSEQLAIRARDYKSLAKSLGTSLLKAEKIVSICEEAGKMKRDLECSALCTRVSKSAQSKSMAMAS